MALANKYNKEDHRIYTILGDGECQEGQVWEAAMAASHYKLDNLLAFVDHNGLQIDGNVTDVMNPTPIDEKFKAFGWNVIVLENGNDLESVIAACEEAKTVKGKPTVVVLTQLRVKAYPSWKTKLAGMELHRVQNSVRKQLQNLKEDVNNGKDGYS